MHTSRWEGFGIVLLEAMLASLPVVATGVSAVPEIVVDGVTGELVDAGDVEGVARALGGVARRRRPAQPSWGRRAASAPGPSSPSRG